MLNSSRPELLLCDCEELSDGWFAYPNRENVRWVIHVCPERREAQFRGEDVAQQGWKCFCGDEAEPIVRLALSILRTAKRRSEVGAA